MNHTITSVASIAHVDTCPVCGGGGQILRFMTHRRVRLMWRQQCDNCHGAGWIRREPNTAAVALRKSVREKV